VNPAPAPAISIIVAVYNGAATLQQCIDSVANQTYPNRELIIIDGGSKDGTLDLFEANREKIDYLVSEPDRGIYSAWNKGLAQAKGEWICFLGADDYFLDSQVLERLAGHLERCSPDILVAYARIMLLNADEVSLYPVGATWEKTKERFKQFMCIPHQGVMHRRGLFERHGQFDESFRIAGDYELLLRELKTADACFIPDIIAVAKREGGISNRFLNIITLLRENRRALKMHGQQLPSELKESLRLFLWNVLGARLTKKVLDLRRHLMGLPPA
jgi:glycosyltransferase involved in cell wall biosynthesis